MRQLPRPEPQRSLSEREGSSPSTISKPDIKQKAARRDDLDGLRCRPGNVRYLARTPLFGFLATKPSSRLSFF